MTAAAADRSHKQKVSDYASYPVAASTTLYLGTFICLDTAGNAVAGADTQGYRFVGVCAQGVDNSSGSAGDENVMVYRKGVHYMVGAGFAATDKGCDLYLADDQTVQKTASNVYVGKMADYVSSTSVPTLIDYACMAPLGEDLDLQNYPVAATTAITVNQMVCLGMDGYLYTAADTKGFQLVGLATETVDNSAGADGDLDCLVQRSGIVQLTGASLTVLDAKKPVWVSNGTTVTTTPSNVFAGILAKYSAATTAYVDIEPATSEEYKDPDIELLPIGATTSITAGQLVCINASGYLITGTTTAGIIFAGVSLEAKDNSAGANGDLSCRVMRTGVWEFTSSSLAITDFGADLYVTNGTTVSKTPANVICGKLACYVSATVARIDIGAATKSPNRGQKIMVGPFHYAGACGHVAVKMFESLEFPTAVKILRGYAHCQTAPGGAYVCTITITDGVTPKTVTITAAATTGEDEAINTVYAPDTDIDVTCIDDNASGATADISVIYVAEVL